MIRHAEAARVPLLVEPGGGREREARVGRGGRGEEVGERGQEREGEEEDEGKELDEDGARACRLGLLLLLTLPWVAGVHARCAEAAWSKSR